MHGRRLAAVVAGVIVVGGGIATVTVIASDDDGPASTTRDPGGHAERPRPTHLALDCGTASAPSGIMDDFTPKGYETPAAAVDFYVDHDGGETVVFTNGADGRRAWILRADGTARATFDVDYRADIGGWSTEYFKACSNEPIGPGARPLNSH